MFKINHIHAKKLDFLPRDDNENKFVFFTGDNGSGKSSRLLEIAYGVLGVQRASNSGTDMRIGFSGKPTKLIAYSMTPFSKFDSREALFLEMDEIVERIGTAGGASRYSLLFQALVEFAHSDTKKEKLFSEISKIANMSTHFRARIAINRARIERHESMASQPDDEIRSAINRFRNVSGTFSVLMKPGEVRISEWPSDDNESNQLSLMGPGDDLFPIDALLYMRRIGALRIVRLETKIAPGAILNKGHDFRAGRLNTTPYGNEKFASTWFSVDRLSSGQLTLFMGLMILASALKDNSVVLIDEPEISLHPAWQRKYCELLYKIAGYHTNCYFFVATHSPIIVSAIDPDKSYIFNLGKEIDGFENISSQKNIEEIFASYFSTITPNSFIVKAAILRTIQAFEDNDRSALESHRTTLSNIRTLLDDNETVEIIDKVLSRTKK